MAVRNYSQQSPPAEAEVTISPAPSPSVEPIESPEAIAPVETPALTPEASPSATPTENLPGLVRDLLRSRENSGSSASENRNQESDKPRRPISNPLRREQEYRDEMNVDDNDDRSSAAPASETQNIPGIPVGTDEQSVLSALGEPTVRNSTGYWDNTRTALYTVVPDRVTLAYIYDKDTDRIRQTEASFDQSTDPGLMQSTLDGMLDGKMNGDIVSGLMAVRDRQTNQFSFSRGNLEGIVERNDRDRVYIAVWDKDLH